MRRPLVHAYMKLGHLLLLALLIVGLLMAGDAVISLYMLLSGQVIPGEPMGVDDLAPSYARAALGFVLGIILSGIGYYGRRKARHWLAANAEMQS